MLRDRIILKGFFTLYYEASLEHLLSSDPRKQAELVSRWAVRQIKDIYMITTPDDHDKAVNLAQSLQKEKYNVFVIPSAPIQSSDFDFYRKSGDFVRKRLRQRSAQILYSSGNTETAETLLVSLLIKGKPGGLDPIRAINAVIGGQPPGKTHKNIIDYSHYLDLARKSKPQPNRIPEAKLKTPGKLADHPELVEQAAFAGPASLQEARIASDQKKKDLVGPVPVEHEEKKSETSESPVLLEIPDAPLLQSDDSENLELDIDFNSPIEELMKLDTTEEQDRKSATTAPSTGLLEGEKKGLKKKKKSKPSPVEKIEDPTMGISIKAKMIIIISIIIAISMGGMIFLASFFFRSDSEIRVQENNLALTDAIGQKVELEIETMIFRSRLMSRSVIQARGAQQNQLVDLFFRENPDFVFMALISAPQAGGSRLKFYNDRRMDEMGLMVQDVDRIFDMNFSEFAPSAGGATIVQNISPGAPVPILAYSIPVRPATPGDYMIVFIDPADVMQSFRSSQTTTTFMVNNRGDVIAHPDSNLLMSRPRLNDLPIVAKMMESPLDNEQTTYTDDKGVTYMGSFKKLGLAGLGVISTVQKNEAFKAVDQIQQRNLIIMGIVLLLAVLIIFFFSRTLSIPIVRLVGATKKIEEGDFHVDIDATTKDEVGVLTRSFARMARGLEEREKMKDAFGKFVNKEIAERVLRGEIKLGGEKKHAAIFFSDLRGFTAMSEGMTPEEVVEFLNEYFTDMVACVNKTQGVVDKFIGDAIMAHWGAVIETGKDTENAVNAALMMRRALFEMNNRPGRPGQKRPKVMFGCGINTGHVISGQIGSEERLEFTVIGDAVNLASRIEALNKPFMTDVLISQDSYELVKDIFRVEKMPAIRVKGKSEPQTIYAVLGRIEDPECPVSMDEVRAMAGIQVDEKKLKALQSDILEEDKEEKYEIIEK